MIAAQTPGGLFLGFLVGEAALNALEIACALAGIPLTGIDAAPGAQVGEIRRRNLDIRHDLMSVTQSAEALRVYIASYFGTPLYPKEQVEKLERDLCVGDHKNCKLYYARGGDDLDKSARGYAGAQRRAALKQMVKNKAAYDANLTCNRTSIARLTARIRNAMILGSPARVVRPLTPSEIESNRAEAGAYLEAAESYRRS